jgi:arginine metabolism regulation protein II
MPPRGGKIKRTKTFTGCSTCRSRGVKCGEEKPTCLRCNKLSLVCGGYGIALVWPGSKQPKVSQRRLMLTGLESSVPAFNEKEISFFLGAIDAEIPAADLTVGLFGVFHTSAHPRERHRGLRTTSEAIPPIVPSSTENQTSTNDTTSKDLEWHPHGPADSFPEIRHKNEIATLETLKWRPGLTFLEPSLYKSMPIQCREERDLMHYWVTYLSPLMIPTVQLDNPFTTIIVPLALSASDDHRESPGRKALRNSVFALCAFSRSFCSTFSVATRERHHALGSKYLQVAFEELGQSLVKSNHEAPEAVLAAILMLVLIGIFTDNYSNYRIHIRGGVEWIQSIGTSIWSRSRDASAIYQIFTGLEALRPAHSILARDLGPQDLSLEYLSPKETGTRITTSNESHSPPDHDTPLMALSETGSYCLDKIFALTKPVLECIMQINRLIFPGTMPVDGEFVALEFKIMASNPELLHFPSLTQVSEKVAHHHACSLWCALYIYYKSSMLRLPPNNMQWLVRQSIEHLDAIEVLYGGLTCSGFLWPLYITGCEAEDKDLRIRTVKLFEERDKLTLGNVTVARKVVSEVWRRRDEGAADVSWHEVMAELGIDILLS